MDLQKCQQNCENRTQCVRHLDIMGGEFKHPLDSFGCFNLTTFCVMFNVDPGLKPRLVFFLLRFSWWYLLGQQWLRDLELCKALIYLQTADIGRIGRIFYSKLTIFKYRIRANKRPLLIRTPEWRYIQILYVLFKFSRLERTKFEYKATLKPSKIYRTPSFYLRGYGN